MKPIQEQPTAVVIGLGTNGLANVRALCQHGVPVIIFLSRKESEEVYAATRYGKKVLVEVTDGVAIIQQLHSLSEKITCILYPTTDYQVQYLSAHRSELPSNCILPCPEQDVVQMLMEKQRFDQFCHSSEFLTPATMLAQNPGHVQWACQKMTFPVIAKTPTKIYKQGLEKAYILSGKDELSAWYDTIHPIHSEFMLQEYIPGTDRSVFFAMQYISADGTLLASFTGKKIRQWLPLRGGTATAEPIYNEYLTNLTYEFFQKARFVGIGSMEYKHDNRTGKFYMIEPTIGRTDFQEGVAIANGVNIPLIAYQDINGQPIQPVFQKKNASKAWMHMLNDRLSRDWYIARKELNYFAWLASLRHVRSFDAFSLNDPGPFILTLQNKVTNQLGKVSSKIRGT